MALPCPGNIRRRAVDALKDRGALADIATGRQAETADQPRAEIAYDVAVEVGQNHHIEALRIGHELHAAVVDDDFLVLELRILLGYFAAAAQKETIAPLHDIRLVNGRNFAATLRGSVIESELCDSQSRPRA